MPKKVPKTKAKRIRPEAGTVAFKMKCWPKCDTKHLYHKCEDGSGPVDLGVIVWYGSKKNILTVQVVDEKLRVWVVTIYDKKYFAVKNPRRK